MEEIFLQSARKEFEFYKSLGEKTFQQLDDKDLFRQFNLESNSIAILVNHLCGNMKSRWTDFLVSDGEKEWRNRDSEFEQQINTRAELLQKWHEGWNCLFGAMDKISKENFSTPVYIRNQKHSIVEAINRQLCHYSSHIGQIVLLGKMMKGEEWISLSIPKGDSKAFNESKFAKGKHGGHFSDDLK